jgi:hypothetical protein
MFADKAYGKWEVCYFLNVVPLVICQLCIFVYMLLLVKASVLSGGVLPSNASAIFVLCLATAELSCLLAFVEL